MEGEPKTRSSRRSLRLAPFAIEALREHRKQQLAERVAAPAWQDQNLVFCGACGGYLGFSTPAYHCHRPP